MSGVCMCVCGGRCVPANLAFLTIYLSILFICFAVSLLCWWRILSHFLPVFLYVLRLHSLSMSLSLLFFFTPVDLMIVPLSPLRVLSPLAKLVLSIIANAVLLLLLFCAVLLLSFVFVYERSGQFFFDFSSLYCVF